MRLHIVLLDIIMPAMGGKEVLKEIKRVDSRVEVFMVTGIFDKEVGKKAIELGAYDYITKAVYFDYLETILITKIIDLLS